MPKPEDEPVDVVVGALLEPTTAPPAPTTSAGTPSRPAPVDMRRTDSKEVAGLNAYRLPARFGKYTLVKRLGVGGMAEAFLAQTEGPSGFQKTSVVKRMLPHLNDDERFVQMFQREAKVAALLTHTNVVQIYELGEVAGIHFIAMEHVDGAPLHKLARTAWKRMKPLPMELICCAVADAALGLHAAHELCDASGKPLGVVHRDISPDNLMMNRDGVTKVLDFGVAKLESGDRTASGAMKGKVPFLSPELIRGERLDGRADLHALGVTFYWLVTAQRPFQAPGELQLIEQIAKEKPKAPNKLNPEVPDVVNDLIMSLLEKDPARRPQTGAEVHDALAGALGSRRSIVMPFVRDLLSGELVADGDNAPAPAFPPATPATETLREAWRRPWTPTMDEPLSDAAMAVDMATTMKVELAEVQDALRVQADPITKEISVPAPPAARPDVTNDDNSATAPNPPAARGDVISSALTLGPDVTAGVDDDEALRAAAIKSGLDSPTRRFRANTKRAQLVAAALGAALVVIGVVAGVIIHGADEGAHEARLPAAPPPPPSGSASASAPLAQAPAPPPATAPPESPPPAPNDGEQRAPAKLVDVQTRGPEWVSWLAGGRTIGVGTTTGLKVPAGTKQLIAVDKRRGGKSPVLIVAGVADYGMAAKAKIAPRANVPADVFLGSDLVGTTPMAAVEVVAGSYKVRLVANGVEQARAVAVLPGQTLPVEVEFAAPGAQKPAPAPTKP